MTFGVAGLDQPGEPGGAGAPEGGQPGDPGDPGRAGVAGEPQLADVVARLRRAMRRAARAQGRGGALPGGLSVAQLELLAALSDTPAARPGQLARSLRLAPSSVATLVNGLLRKQMVTRTGGEADRRTALIQLTAAGQDAVARWQQVNARILHAALAALPPGSRTALLGSLPDLSLLADAVDALADAAGQPDRATA